jgi:trehalose synthase
MDRLVSQRPGVALGNNASHAAARATLGAQSLESYEPLIGAQAVDRILAKADAVKDVRVAHISSTFYGGGVAELLTPLTLLMNTVGIQTVWHLVQGTPAFFHCTKHSL